MRENGDAISRTVYAKLFALIGTTYGVGDGATTFNLPDVRGDFERNLDDGRGVDAGRALGSSQAGQNEAHTHGVIDPGHQHSVGTLVVPTAGNTGLGSSGANAQGVTTASSTTGISTVSSGGSETRPRNMAFLAIIKAF
jgi:microcystin-dependent protein